MPSYIEKQEIAARFRSLIFPLVLIAYVLSAEFGHALSLPEQFATFWPPAGIALAAFLFVPPAYWSRVMAGTFIANICSDVFLHEKTIAVSIGFWIANTCEALFAVWLLKRVSKDESFLWTAKSVFQFVLLPCLLGTALGASIGAGVIWMAYGSNYMATWRVWWSGDFIGMLIVFPLVWLLIESMTARGFASIRSKFESRYSVAEFVVLLLLLAFASWYIFGLQNQRLAYAVYPLLLALSTRFRILGATTALAVLAVVTVAHTAAGNGLFGEIPNAVERAAVLQIYLFVTASTFLTLAASSRERWSAEKSQEEAQRKLVTATRGGEVGLWDWNLQTDHVTWSDECHRQLGEQPGQLNDFSDWERRCHPDDITTAKQCVAEAIESDTGEYESTFRLRHQNGNYRWILSRGRLELDAERKPLRMSGSHVDITELKEVRDQLESYLNLLGATDGGWNWNLATNAVDYSLRFRELLGFAADSNDLFPATLAAIRERIHPDDWKTLKRSIIKHLKFDSPFECELRIMVEAGEYRWFRARGLALKDDTERPQRMAGSIYDITDRKNIELSLQGRNSELAQFAYVASHDLQEPLRAVSGFCQLLELRYSDQLDEKGQSYVRHAVSGAKRMKNLIDDLLEFSRVSHGAIESRRVDLNAVAEKAIQTLSYLITERGAQIDCDALPTLSGHETMLMQLFQNLITNAIKFQKPDTIAEVKISSRRNGDNWEILVSDNGIGIEPNHRERIFDMFERVHNRSEFDGTGIGLAICQKIVMRHHGSIRVESQPGAGCTFVISLPHKSSLNWKRTNPPETPAVPSSGKAKLATETAGSR